MRLPSSYAETSSGRTSVAGRGNGSPNIRRYGRIETVQLVPATRLPPHESPVDANVTTTRSPTRTVARSSVLGSTSA
jgi:hypothetical protein